MVVMKYKNIQHLLRFADWALVEVALETLYPDQIGFIEGYKKVWVNLRQRKRIQTSSVWSLDMCFIDDPGDPSDSYWSVGLRSKKEPGVNYGFSFMPWRQIISAYIDELPIMWEEEMVAHILWEITFYGFDEQEIMNKGKEIAQIALDAKYELNRRLGESKTS